MFYWLVSLILIEEINVKSYYNSNYMTIIYKYKFML